MFVGGTMPYFIFYVFLFTFLLPLFHSLIVLTRLKGSVQIPKGSLYAGDKITIKYEVNNNSKFNIPYLEIESNISKELSGIDSPKIITMLEPKKAFRQEETIVLKRRGYYEIGEIEVTVRDVFGFFSLKKKIASETSLLVYPEIINLFTFRITTVEQLGELMVKNPAFQDRSRISSLRDYREGDFVKSIHWKLSSKLDNLVIKEYENRGDTHVVVLIDNYQKLYDGDVDRHLEDKAADVALSIVNYYINQNIPINFQTQDNENIIDIQGQQKFQMKSFLDTFARFKGNGAFDFNSFLKSRINAIRKDATVVIITPNLDKSMGTLGILLKTKYLKPLMIVLTDRENNKGSLNPVVEKGLRQEGIPIYVIDYKTNIKEALEAQYG